MIRVKITESKLTAEYFNIVKLFFGYNEVVLARDEDFDYEIKINDNNLDIKNKEGNLKSYNFDNITSKENNVKRAIFKYFREMFGISPPWGTLVGIRPTKKALEMLNENKSYEEIINFFKENNETSEEKARLCIDVARFERKYAKEDKKTVSIYIGMPFCPTKCLYCSFTSHQIKGCKHNIVEKYLYALKKEIEAIREYIDRKKLKIQTVYFGGGTPTAVKDEEFKEIMKVIYNNFVKNRSLEEFTIECGRPDSITLDKLLSMREFKVSRISINPQTMNKETLKIIGRSHTPEEVIEKFKLARTLGFDNINMDIIIGLPNEGRKEVKYTCNEIYKLNPESVTVHGLAIKRGSRLQEALKNNNKYSIANNEEIIDMYEEVHKLCKNLNSTPYYMYRQKNMVGNMENVGFAKEKKECIYNIQMIEDKQNIIAVGAYGVSKILFYDTGIIKRFANIKDVYEYEKRIHEQIEKKIEFFDMVYK